MDAGSRDGCLCFERLESHITGWSKRCGGDDGGDAESATRILGLNSYTTFEASLSLGALSDRDVVTSLVLHRLQHSEYRTMAAITMRPPSFSPAKPPPGYASPSIAWLTETWHVTHSTLPMWKSKRNVRISCTPLPPSDPGFEKANTDRIDDVVSYQALDKTKVQTVHGIDKLTATGEARDAWDWHSKGALALAGPLAKSHWEVLGWGEEAGTGNKWVVTMFAKTMFTPPGIDVYSRDRGGLGQDTLARLKLALGQVDDADVRKMAGEIFEIKTDDARHD